MTETYKVIVAGNGDFKTYDSFKSKESAISCAIRLRKTEPSSVYVQKVTIESIKF